MGVKIQREEDDGFYDAYDHDEYMAYTYTIVRSPHGLCSSHIFYHIGNGPH